MSEIGTILITSGVVVAIVEGLREFIINRCNRKDALTDKAMEKEASEELEFRVKMADELDEIKSLLKSNAVAQDKLCSATMFSLGQNIANLCERYLKRGYISTEELKLLGDMYNSYKAIGGDGTITRLVNRCEQLPYNDLNDIERKEHSGTNMVGDTAADC